MTTPASRDPGPVESHGRAHAHRRPVAARRERAALRGREPVAASRAGHGRAWCRGGRRSGGPRRGRRVPGLALPSGPRSRARAHAHRRRARGHRRRARAADRGRDRQRHSHAGPRRGGRSGRRVPVLRRSGRRAEGRGAAARRWDAELQRPGASGRRGGDRALERAGVARLVEDRDGAVHREHPRAQGGRGCAARRPATRRGLRAASARRGLERADRLRRGVRRPAAQPPGIAKITFTGSTEVGRIAMRAAAERILPVSLELGGKAPAIVYADSDDDATVAHVITAMRFARQGQSCTAGSQAVRPRERLRRLHGKAGRQARRDGRRRRARRALGHRLGRLTHTARARVRRT